MCKFLYENEKVRSGSKEALLLERVVRGKSILLFSLRSIEGNSVLIIVKFARRVGVRVLPLGAFYSKRHQMLVQLLEVG